MKKDVKTAKLIKKAKPFAKLWTDIRRNRSLKKEYGYSFVTISIEKEFDNLFSYIRNGDSDFIFIDGITDSIRICGLLCMEENRAFANPDNCFFVGDVFLEKTEKSVFLTAWQLNDLIGENGQYLVCKVILQKKGKIISTNIRSFLTVIEKCRESL